ncbi:FG-GAP repeat protein [Oceanospirillaceae bacterium]|nr:FG-GAP repeat protein [Oceanospirillaceae bacterium]
MVWGCVRCEFRWQHIGCRSSPWAKTSFLKAPNTGSSDQFSVSIAMDETGATMVVGAAKESSNATGVTGTGQTNNGTSGAGAVYVY